MVVARRSTPPVPPATRPLAPPLLRVGARRRWRLGDPAFRALAAGFALSVVGIALLIAALLFVYGTVVTSALALALAVPFGLGAAVCLAELLPRSVADPLAFLIELLVAVPSVVYGLVGIFVLVPVMRTLTAPVAAALGWIPLFAGPTYGVGLATAGVVLAVMIVPFIVAVSREVLLAVPQAQRDAALAL